MTTSKTQMLDALYQDWESSFEEYKGKFFKDGIINETQFENVSRKILFICKEVNEPNKDVYDIRDKWGRGEVGTFAWVIAELAYGIFNNFPPFDEIYNYDQRDEWFPKYKDLLNSIAFINVKKTTGIGNSNYDEIVQHAEKNKVYLQNQIEIIHPDLILHSAGLRVRNILFDNIISEWKPSGYRFDVVKREYCKIIDFCHPSQRTTRAGCYALLKCIYESQIFREL